MGKEFLQRKDHSDQSSLPAGAGDTCARPGQVELGPGEQQPLSARRKHIHTFVFACRDPFSLVHEYPHLGDYNREMRSHVLTTNMGTRMGFPDHG